MKTRLQQDMSHLNQQLKSAIYFLAIVIVSSVRSAFPPSLRYQVPIAVNKITEITLSCDSGSINATVTLQHPFKGILFAKDFSHECKTIGSLSNSVSINLPTSGCGVRLSTTDEGEGGKRMFYSVTLVAQQDRYLRQIADQEKHVECPINEDAFSVRSRFVDEVVKNDLTEVKNNRVGRMKKADPEIDTSTDDMQEALMAARAWMEIMPEEQQKSNDILKVGDQVLLSIKSTLPDGIGWKIVDCVAHDGLGDSSQKLLDEEGCPIDELLMPVPEFGPTQPISLMRHQEAVSKFAAFKFPDRDRLHLACSLELCKGNCLDIDCNDSTKTSDNRLGRTLSTEGRVLDRLKVYNSIEVIAPAIDDFRQNERLRSSEPSIYPFSNLPGDRTFCVSPDKIALTFCILGLIFLCAVVVAAFALFRARRNGSEGPFYTRSLFSSSSSGGSAYGSKLLLHESPCMGQPAPSSRGMHYGRIL